MQKEELHILVKSSTLEALFQKIENIEKVLCQHFQNKSHSIHSEHETCKILHMSLKTLQNLRKNGDIKFSRAPGKARKIIYTQKQIEDFLNKNEYNA